MIKADVILAVTALSLCAALPAQAADDPASHASQTPIIVNGTPADGITLRQRRVPNQLTAAEVSAYAQIFRDIEAGRFGKADQALGIMAESGLLSGSARAEIYLAQGTGKANAAKLTDWLTRNQDLPQAPRIAGLAAARGANALPTLPASTMLRSISFTPRMTPKSAKVGDGFGDGNLVNLLKPLLAENANALAEAFWRELSPDVAVAVRTEWAQRIAWSYYGSSDDISAIRMGQEASKASGEWAALGDWVVGLAAFRQGDCSQSLRAFTSIGPKRPPDDLAAAGAYWASRAALACARPQLVTPLLRQAASYHSSFYGLLAQRTLGLAQPFNWTEPDFITADWNHLKAKPGARRAAALVEIGQLGLADRELRYLASTSPAPEYEPLLRLAARLNLPATQYWLAHHPPLGAEPPISARFPAPDWVPYRGWRVDQALVYAHALQESNFVTDVTSHAGAKGLMQLMPGTASLIKNGTASLIKNGTASLIKNGTASLIKNGTAKQGVSSFDAPYAAASPDLSDPAFNIELGQSYLEKLRDLPYTGALLPKVIAAYNAGPGSVQKWNTSLRDNGDPLLFIESIPFKETRHYVEIVLRNFWMYQLRNDTPTDSIDALAQGLWPKFPGMAGPSGVKIVAPPWLAPLPPLPTTSIMTSSNGH